MPGRCANPSCSAPRHPDQGKLFRLDIEIGSAAGPQRTKTAFVWLCPSCARQMNPKVEVVGDTVRLLLATIPAGPVARAYEPGALRTSIQ